jgi:hypothetical protein
MSDKTRNRPVLRSTELPVSRRQELGGTRYSGRISPRFLALSEALGPGDPVDREWAEFYGPIPATPTPPAPAARVEASTAVAPSTPATDLSDLTRPTLGLLLNLVPELTVSVDPAKAQWNRG